MGRLPPLTQRWSPCPRNLPGEQLPHREVFGEAEVPTGPPCRSWELWRPGGREGLAFLLFLFHLGLPLPWGPLFLGLAPVSKNTVRTSKEGCTRPGAPPAEALAVSLGPRPEYCPPLTCCLLLLQPHGAGGSAARHHRGRHQPAL